MDSLLPNRSPHFYSRRTIAMSGKYEYTELYKTDKILFYKEKILLFILVHAIMNKEKILLFILVHAIMNKEKILLFILVHAIMNKEKILLFILVHAIMNKKRSKFIYAVGLYYRIGGSL
ncbi:hypothetical protein RGL65_004137 [Vibrio parahaemolyticus]|nr:hypothetical protein [Vibrio parahaemolyticus]